MTPNDYQQLCLKTWNIEPFLMDQKHNAVYGLSGETGETIDLLKKVFFHKHPLDRDKLIKELGDVQYYLAVLADLFGIDLETIMEKNIEKLSKRYKGGGFDSKLSMNRNETKE